jgi:sugar-specific transcriptional regulator TrmB
MTSKKIMQEDLKKLGLTENEISVYLSLLKVGETSVGGIINDLKWHRQLIYNALDALEKRNMVERTIKNKVNHYKVADPKIIVENLQKQELIAKRLSKNIEEEIKKSKHEHEINVYDNVQRIRQYFLKAYSECAIGSTIYILSGYAYKFGEVLGEDFLYKKYDKIRTQRKIHSKLIASEVIREEQIEFHKNLNQEIRTMKFLPYKSASPVTTIIWPWGIAYQSFYDDPFIIEIKNQKFRESYLEHFDFLWQIAKK